MNKNEIGRPKKYKFVLGEIMKEKKITSQALADKTDIPKQTIDQYRSGRREPNVFYGMIIAEALGVDLKELVKEDTE